MELPHLIQAQLSRILPRRIGKAQGGESAFFSPATVRLILSQVHTVHTRLAGLSEEEKARLLAKKLQIAVLEQQGGAISATRSDRALGAIFISSRRSSPMN